MLYVSVTCALKLTLQVNNRFNRQISCFAAQFSFLPGRGRPKFWRSENSIKSKIFVHIGNFLVPDISSYLTEGTAVTLTAEAESPPPSSPFASSTKVDNGLMDIIASATKTLQWKTIHKNAMAAEPIVTSLNSFNPNPPKVGSYLA